MTSSDRFSEKLTTAQWSALRALVAGSDYAAAASVSGVSVRTVRRWRTLKWFRSELEAEQSRVMEASCLRLGNLTQKALSVLEDMMDDPEVAAGVRVRAAGLVIDAALRWKEVADLAARVENLERSLST